MQWVLGYLVVAAISIGMLTGLIRRSQKPRHGAAYARAALLWSSTLLAIYLILFFFTGFWIMSPVAVIAVGFIIPAVMLAIT